MNIDSTRALMLGGVLLAAAASQLAVAGPQAGIRASTSGVYHKGEIIDDARLAQIRGGFRMAGLEVYFGATLKTIVDETRLTTVLNFTGNGAQVVSRTVTSTAPAMQVTRVGRHGVPLGEITPPDIQLAGLAPSSGIVIDDAKGFTAALHNITDNAIISSVISNASGRSIRQKIDISVHIANMAELRAAQMRSSIVNSLLLP